METVVRCWRRASEWATQIGWNTSAGRATKLVYTLGRRRRRRRCAEVPRRGAPPDRPSVRRRRSTAVKHEEPAFIFIKRCLSPTPAGRPARGCSGWDSRPRRRTVAWCGWPPPRSRAPVTVTTSASSQCTDTETPRRMERLTQSRLALVRPCCCCCCCCCSLHVVVSSQTQRRITLLARPRATRRCDCLKSCHWTTSSATTDGPRHALRQPKSQLLHNCRKKVLNKSKTNRSDGVNSEGSIWPMCSKQPRLIDCRIGFVSRLDGGWVLLTTLSACRGEIL